MRGSSLGLFIVVLVVFISVADGAKKCYKCAGKDDCKSPKEEECTYFGGILSKSAESGSSPGSDSDKPAKVSKPTEAPAAEGGARKKRDVDVSCASGYDKDGNAIVKRCFPGKAPKDECEEKGGETACLCNSDLCNGSSLPKSISIWGLGLIALLLVLHSSKLL